MSGKLTDHNDLMKKMAARGDVDLGKALIEGRLDAGRYRNSVIRCSHCQSAYICKALLATEKGVREEIPLYCVNSALFKGLRSAVG